MEASALPAPSGLARTRISIGAPLLRLRSDEQLVVLFREGNEEAFRAIHDRYAQRLLAYARQMLPGSRQDAEDALQDVFVRAYGALRADGRRLALRPWLYRVAHNRCVDELRRPQLPVPELVTLGRGRVDDPIAAAEQRDSLRRLLIDLRRLPEQQRSALLMRELAGLSYCELASALCVSEPAVKSLLVRARVGLAKSAEARDMSCTLIRDELLAAHDRGVRPGGLTRRHLRDCRACTEFRTEMRSTSRQLAALVPATGLTGALGNLLGWGSGHGAASSSGAAASGGAASGAVASGGAVASVGLANGIPHVAAVLAAVVTAGGAVAIQHSLAGSEHAGGARAAAETRALVPAAAIREPQRPRLFIPAVTAAASIGAKSTASHSRPGSSGARSAARSSAFVQPASGKSTTSVSSLRRPGVRAPAEKLLQTTPTTLGSTGPTDTGPTGSSGGPSGPPPGGGASGEGGSGGSGIPAGKPPTLPTVGRTSFGKSGAGGHGGPALKS